MRHRSLQTTIAHSATAAGRSWLAAEDAAIVRQQVTVSEIAAPTGDEERRASWMRERFAELGLRRVRIDAEGNVIGERTGRTRDASVVVMAHLDTVFPIGTELRVRREGRRLIGPGIGDNGRGLAGMLAVAAALDAAQLQTRRPIMFVATTGEEGGGDLRGARHFFKTANESVAAVIALDGAGDERVVRRAVGARRFRIEFTGPGGHSWAAFGVVNPVHAAAATASRLAALILPREPRTTLTVARIGGGFAINAVPEDAWLDVDTRSASLSVLDRLERELRDAVRAAAQVENERRAAGTPTLGARITITGDRPCGEVDEDHPLVEAAIHATRLAGRTPELAAASTDANIPLSLGIPAVTIGAGGAGGDVHTTAEWFENTDGGAGLGRALTLVAAAADVR